MPWKYIIVHSCLEIILPLWSYFNIIENSIRLCDRPIQYTYNHNVYIIQYFHIVPDLFPKAIY